jgi:uncharacterized protein
VEPHILVMAKSPVAGRVKTRLCPPYSPEEAAEVAAAALADTLSAVAGTGAARKVLALEGQPGPWIPEGFQVIPQCGGSLAERLAHAWVRSGPGGIQIGMDTPQVTAAELDRLLQVVDTSAGTAVLGHAVDGGWWVIGWRRADAPAVFRGVPTSCANTGRMQERRLRALGFRVHHAPVLRDIDTAADLAAVASASPHTVTASVAARLARGLDAA